MPDLKHLYRALYILINCLFKQVVNNFNKFTIKSRTYINYMYIG